MGHRFNPQHIDKLNSPQRRKMLPPERMLVELDIQSENTVVDIGCGPGYFSIPAARMTEQTVFGVDISPEMLDFLLTKAAEEGIHNISAIESSAEHIGLPNQSVDRIICSFVLHEVDDFNLALNEFGRILRPGGKILVIEWEKKATQFGPPVHERIEAGALESNLQNLGYSCRRIQPNPDQYAFCAEIVDAVGDRRG